MMDFSTYIIIFFLTIHEFCKLELNCSLFTTGWQYNNLFLSQVTCLNPNSVICTNHDSADFFCCYIIIIIIRPYMCAVLQLAAVWLHGA